MSENQNESLAYECDCCWAATYADGPCVECGCEPGETCEMEKP